MFDESALANWLDETLEPALASAERYQSGWPSFSREAQQRRTEDLAELARFIEDGCRECPLGYRDGTVDALLLHLMIVLDSPLLPRLRCLRQLLRQLAVEGLLPHELLGAAVRPAYAPRRRVLPGAQAVKD